MIIIRIFRRYYKTFGLLFVSKPTGNIVSMLLQIIGQIRAFDKGGTSF